MNPSTIAEARDKEAAAFSPDYNALCRIISAHPFAWGYSSGRAMKEGIRLMMAVRVARQMPSDVQLLGWRWTEGLTQPPNEDAWLGWARSVARYALERKGSP